MNLINNSSLIELANKQLLIEDVNRQYIYLSDVPQYFGVGKNSFLVGVNQGYFQVNSKINIYFIAANGDLLPVKVTQFKQKLYIRCYVQIDQSNAVGFGTLVICGILKKTLSGIPITGEWKNNLNVKYVKKIYVSNNELSPSVLRFKNKPTIKTSINQKKLYQYDVETLTQEIKIKDISYPNGSITVGGKKLNRAQFFKLQVDSESISESVFYQKFLYYTHTDDLVQASSNDRLIYSGSIELKNLPIGNYRGECQFTNSVNDFMLSDLECTLWNVDINFNKLYTNVMRGYNLDRFIINNKYPQQYNFYFQIADFQTNNYTIRDDSDIKINPVKYLDYISTAEKITFNTNYYSGSIDSSNTGTIYSQQFKLNKSVTGKPKNPLINSNRFQQIDLQADIVYNNHIFSSSDETYSMLSTKYTQFVQTDLSDFWFESGDVQQIMRFDFLQGMLYQKKYYGDSGRSADSYFDGQMIGFGEITTKDSNGRIYDITTGNYRNVSQGSSINLTTTMKFVGAGYVVGNLKIECFSGSIYSGSLQSDNTIQLNKFYTQGIKYQQMYITSKQINLEFYDVNLVEMVQPNKIMQLDLFQMATKPNQKDSYIFINSNIKISLKNLTNQKLRLQGRFSVERGNTYISTFDGLYQLNQGDNGQIQQFELQDVMLTKKYQKIFNTSKVMFDVNDYKNIYVPIAITGGNSLPQLKKIFNINDNNVDSIIQINYSFKNKFNPGRMIDTSQFFPLTIQISDIDVYSGHYSEVQVYYSNQAQDNTYQLLTTIQLDSNQTSVIKSIDLPVLNFFGQSTNLQFRHVDANGNYAPAKFFNDIYDIRLNTQQSLNLQRLYGANYIGQITGGVQSVNDKTGVVWIYSEDVPYSDTNVKQALDYLYGIGGITPPGPGGGSYVSWVIEPIDSISNITIGEYFSYKFQWNVNPLATIDSYVYTISLAQYGDDQNWVQDSSGSIATNLTEFVFPNSEESIKFTLTSKTSANQYQTIEMYKYRRNYIGAWVNQGTQYEYDIFKFLQSQDQLFLQDTYQKQYVVNAGQGQYIYISHPSRLQLPTTENQIYFQVNGFAGGFTSLGEYPLKNTYGYEQKYNTYKSVNRNLGLTLIKVKNYYNIT